MAREKGEISRAPAQREQGLADRGRCRQTPQCKSGSRGLPPDRGGIMVKVQRAEGGAVVVLQRIGRGVQANDCAKRACKRVGESRQGAEGGMRMMLIRCGVLLEEIVFRVDS